MKKSVTVNFKCKHSIPIEVRVDADVTVPTEVKGLGKCPECLNQPNLIAITGVDPAADGSLTLDSVFMMPIEG